jgi:hypothetical protein
VLADVALLCFFLKKDFSIPVPAYLDTLISALAPRLPGMERDKFRHESTLGSAQNNQCLAIE